MSYYLHLAKQYMWRNKARTAYSVLGIFLTFIMCFSVMTVFYSVWDYNFLKDYNSQPYEFYTISRDIELTPAVIENIKRLEKDERVAKLSIWCPDIYCQNGRRLVLTSSLKPDDEEEYYLWLKLKEIGDLKGTAQSIKDEYGIEFKIRNAVLEYYRQDESLKSALINLLLTLAVMVCGGFCVAVLRNTMMISVAERVRDYGLLRCVGMSESQLKILLLTEGFCMSLLASIFGIIFGYGGLQLIEPWLISMLELESYFSFGFYPKAAVFVTLLCVAVTLFSLLEPSRQAGLVSPVEALHGVYGASSKKKKTRMKKRREGIMSRIFGPAGFYAGRNMKYGRGHHIPVFVAMFFSVAFLLTVFSFSSTYEATLSASLGYQYYYQESVYRHKDWRIQTGTTGARQGHYGLIYGDDEVMVRRTLEKRTDVEDTLGLIESAENTVKPLDGSYLYDIDLYGQMKQNNIVLLEAIALGADDIEKERQYLTEGEINYENMVNENGILICDNSSNGRLTDYKPGDTIKILSVAGAARAKAAFLNAIVEIAQRNRMQAYDTVDFREDKPEETVYTWNKEALLYRIKQGVDDTEYDELFEELLTELEGCGYDIRDKADDIYSIIDLLAVLKGYEYEHGAVEICTVEGILADDIYYESAYNMGYETEGYTLYMVYAMDTALRRCNEIREEEIAFGEELPDGVFMKADIITNASYEDFYPRVALHRKMQFPDRQISRYASDKDLYHSDRNECIDHAENIKKQRVTKVVVTLSSSFVIVVCMVQIINTLQANMRTRKKELWVYNVVGMSGRMRFKMLMIEYGFSAVLAVTLGCLSSLILSYVFIEKFMDVNGKFEYHWPYLTAILISACILGLILLTNHIEIRNINEEHREIK